MTPGTVYLVGAGPGDPGLLTLRAAELLGAARVVAHDSLIPPGILAMAAADAETIAVGRRHGDGTVVRRIHPAVLERARAGVDVVRLKAGDPFVFGRGGEEAEALAEAGIPFQVVPGISAALGAAAYAGIPLTHRAHASAVTFATGHRVPATANHADTVVLYMATRHARDNIGKLVAAGRAPSTPAACISCATRTDQQVVVGTLATLAAAMNAAGVALPALLVVGDVVDVRRHIAWTAGAPLLGRRIVVARARPGTSPLAQRLRALGAAVIEAPTLATAPWQPARAVDDALAHLSDLDGVVFGCVDSVRVAAERLGTQLAARLERVPVIAIGAPVARALSAAGVTPARVCAGACRDGLAAHDVWRGRSLVLWSSDRGRPQLVADMTFLGARVQTRGLYRIIASSARLPDGTFDAVVLPSSSATRALLQCQHATRLAPVPAVAIGARTAAAARAGGWTAVSCSAQDTPDSVVAWLLAHCAPRAAAPLPMRSAS